MATTRLAGPCNGWNPGLAVEARDGGFLAGAGGYRDSYNTFAKMAYVGYSYRHAVSENWFVGATVRAGYLDGSGFHNWVPLPSIEVGYKRVSLEATFIPAIKSSQCGVLALWGESEFLTMTNLLLIGQAEEIDLVQPQVRQMLANPGIYIAGDTTNPELTVVLASQAGRVSSMTLDGELDPASFLPTLTLHGPYLAEEPAESARLKLLQAIVDEVHAWAVCAGIASPEDMAQNFPRIVDITAPNATAPAQHDTSSSKTTTRARRT
ncbi:MAG: hypothetical protein WDN30_14325 [Pararobbsia sp.]